MAAERRNQAAGVCMVVDGRDCRTRIVEEGAPAMGAHHALKRFCPGGCRGALPAIADPGGQAPHEGERRRAQQATLHNHQ